MVLNDPTVFLSDFGVCARVKNETCRLIVKATGIRLGGGRLWSGFRPGRRRRVRVATPKTEVLGGGMREPF